MAWWIFQHVVTTALLASLVTVVCHMTRIGPVARHALWVLVLIKFVTPPLVAWPWTVPDPLGLSAIETTAAVQWSDSGVSAVEVEAEPFVATSDAHRSIGALTPSAPYVASDVSPDAALLWLLGLWVTGSVLLATIEGIRLFRLAQRTRAAAPAPSALKARVAWHAGRMGLGPVPIVLVAGATAPSVWGLVRPRILWPATLGEDVSEVGTDGLIVHELAHVKRRDHLVGWIELVGGIVWWWNPLFWSVRSALREQAELACDAWVISALPNGRRAYAESLLALSSEVPRSLRSSMAVVGISATTRRALERRLVMIMKGRASLRLTFVGICSLAVVAAATLPTWAASPQVAAPPAVAPAPAAAPPAAPPAMAALPVAPPPQSAATPTSKPPSAPPAVQAPLLRPTVGQRPSVPPTMPSAAGQRPAGRGRGGISPNLPEAARPLADAFSKDQQAYLQEMLQKVAARREVFTAEMQRLQDELTKEGRLDEAVAIRDYLRMAAPVANPGAGRGRAGGGGR